MAYSVPIELKCSYCKQLREAKHDVFNKFNARMGRACTSCVKKAVERLQDLEDDFESKRPKLDPGGG